MSIELAKVPLPIRRKAAQHLESIRGTPMAPNARNAHLSDEVWPVYRPDLEEVAYYEFGVELGSGPRRLVTSPAELSELLAAERKTVTARSRRTEASLKERAGASRSVSRGFIVVSTGPHDFPIPHWSLDRAPVSAQLEASAEKGGAIERIYRLDALAYVAEFEGRHAGRTGRPAAGAGGRAASRPAAVRCRALDARGNADRRSEDRRSGGGRRTPGQANGGPGPRAETDRSRRLGLVPGALCRRVRAVPRRLAAASGTRLGGRCARRGVRRGDPRRGDPARGPARSRSRRRAGRRRRAVRRREAR